MSYWMATDLNNPYNKGETLGFLSVRGVVLSSLVQLI